MYFYFFQTDVLSNFFIQLKVDLHLASFSRMNDIFHWRILCFQSPFDKNEILIICENTYSWTHAIQTPIIRKSTKSKKLFGPFRTY